MFSRKPGNSTILDREVAKTADGRKVPVRDALVGCGVIYVISALCYAAGVMAANAVFYVIKKLFHLTEV